MSDKPLITYEDVMSADSNYRNEHVEPQHLFAHAGGVAERLDALVKERLRGQAPFALTEQERADIFAALVTRHRWIGQNAETVGQPEEKMERLERLIDRLDKLHPGSEKENSDAASST